MGSLISLIHQFMSSPMRALHQVSFAVVFGMLKWRRSQSS
jgi:hypothetical protein